MKYRTKLYISLVGIASASIVLGLIIFSTETESFIFNMLRSRSVSIAATAASQLDPELFAKVNTVRDVEDPAYQQALKKLRQVLMVNRRKDVYISDIYTLYINPNNPQQLLYGVETALAPDVPGSPYTDSDKELILKNHNTYFSDPNFVSDQYGVWLSGFAPIRDDEGNYIATLGVDINAADIHMRIRELIKFAFWGLLASLGLAFLVAFILAKRVTVSLDHLCDVVKEIEQGNLEIRAHLETNDEFGELGRRINEMCEGLQERERLKMSFARYVSAHILDKILTSESPLKLEGERRKVTLLFSDIRQFTLLAEKLPPEQVVHILNGYFEQMIEVIFSHSGTLDKFIGDGIMAEFGAPLDDPQQEKHAVEAAIHMHKALNALSLEWQKQGNPQIEMGIGIHTGDAVVGNVGSEKRTEYTAIGDTVNVASRLEQATKKLKVPLLISHTTYLATKDHFPYIDLGTLDLPGREEDIQVYTIDFNKV